MEYLGVSYEAKHLPELDPQFIPFGVWMNAYRVGAEMPLAIAVERDQGHISAHRTKIHGTPEMAEADYRYVERFVKFLLWSIGGFRIYVCGCSPLAQRLKEAYTLAGERKFDAQFMQDVYEVPMEVLDLPLEQCPQANESAVPLAAIWRVAASALTLAAQTGRSPPVVDGQTVYSEEVVWHPKTQEDPSTILMGLWRRPPLPPPRCPGWTPLACPLPVCSLAMRLWFLPCLSRSPGKSGSW